jgi:hypothetical protein
MKANPRIIEITDSQMMHPARHFRAYMKTKEMRMAKPKAARRYCQFYIV